MTKIQICYLKQEKIFIRKGIKRRTK